MKKFIQLFSVFIICFLLTGCVQCQIELEIKNKDHAQFTMEFLISDDALNTTGKTINDYKEQFFASNDQFQDWTFENTTKTIDDESYQGLIITAPESYTQDILDHLTVTKDDHQTTYQLNLTDEEMKKIDTSELSQYTSTISLLQGQGAKFEFDIIMPGTISETSIGQINDDHVTINLLNYIQDSELKDIKIVSVEKTNDNVYLYIGIGVIVIIALISIYLYTKKRKQS